MGKNFSYKQKLKAIGIAAVIIFIICYRFAFSKTIVEYSLYKKQSNYASVLNNQENSINSLKYKEKKINEFFGQFILDTLQNEKNFLFVSSKFCTSNYLKIKEYTPYAISKESNVNIATKSITIEGSFNNIVKLIYYLEMEHQIGRIVSTNYKSITDGKEKKLKLNCTIYIQNLLFNNDDK